MMRAHKTAWILLLLLGMLSTSAYAKKAVVPPFVARSISAEQKLSMTTLIASELELMGDFDEVAQLDKSPSGWSSGCISSSSCLSSIARKAGAQALLGGSISKRGDEYEVKLVYFSGGKIVRNKTTRMSTDPIQVADQLANHARLVVTGVSPTDKEEAQRVQGFESDDFLDEEEDDSIIVPPPVSRRIATPPPRSQQPVQLEDPQEGRGYAPAPVPPPARQPPPRQQEEVRVEDFQFGDATKLIQVDTPEPRRQQQQQPPPRQQPVYRPPVQQTYEDPPDTPPQTRRYDDLDDPQPPPRPVRQAPQRVRKPPTQRDRGDRDRRNSNAGTFGLAGRLGYSNFQTLNFLTYGIEGAFQVQDMLAIVAGLEAYSVRRELPVELVPQGEPAVQWNTILPFNLGVLYKPSATDIRPYVGAGAQIIPGYVKSTGGAAYGFRGRGGVDFILADNFGLNLNVAAGIWSGEHFNEVQEGLKPTGLVPQISGGTIFIF